MCFLSGLILIQCKKENTAETKNDQILTQNPTDSIAKKDTVVAEPVAKENIKFTALVFPKGKKKKDSAMAAFNDKFSKEERYIILALNRLDSKNKWRADTLVIPVSYTHLRAHET